MPTPPDDPVAEEVRPPQPRDQGRIELAQPTVTPAMLGLYRLWTATKGSLSIDLKRQGPVPRSAQATLLTTRRQAERRRGAPSWRGYTAAPQRGQFAQQPAQAYGAAAGELPTVAFSDTGGYCGSSSLAGSTPALGPAAAFFNIQVPVSAPSRVAGGRVKAMRHVSFGPEFEFVKNGVPRTAPSLDLGLGFEFEYDTAQLKPHARLKFRDFLSVKAFPEPALKLQKRVVLGTSGYGVRLSYEVPLARVGSFWEPPARLMVR